MRAIAVTQRVSIDASHGERRDCLDQAWVELLVLCGFLPVLIPNNPAMVGAICQASSVAGVVLTGGNDLISCGGDAPERDETERVLLDLALAKGWPVLGVCRGMQFIQQRFGVKLERVHGHVLSHQKIFIKDQETEVNSFHHFGAYNTPPPLMTWAHAADGVVKAIRHLEGSILAFMWHPERLAPFSARDIDLIQRHLGES